MLKYGLIIIQTMKPSDLNLTLIPKLSKLGRPYRLSAIAKNGQKPSKWVNKSECWCWYYVFLYTDDNSFFGVEFGYNDEFIRKLNDTDCKELFTLKN